MKILFLSRWYPYPINNGSKLRIYHLLRGLAQHHEVTLLSFADQPDVDPNAPEIQSLCCDVIVVPWRPFDPHSWRARLGFLSVTPRSVIDTFSPDMAEQINQTLAGKAWDLIIASQIDMAAYGYAFRHRPALLEEIEVAVPYEKFSQANSTWSRFRHGLTWAKQRYYMARLLRDYRACTVASAREQQLLSSNIPTAKAIEVIPNCINLTDYSDVHVTSQPNGLIFTGSFRYSANHDAMVWFLREVYPLVQAQVSEVQLTITGDHANLPLPPADHVVLTGFVDDVRPLIAAASVSLVPLRIGGGTRLKILEAMALRTPVVATSKGAEGLEAQPNEHLLLADTPEAFAEAIVRLLREPDLRQRLADQAYQLVAEKYDWAIVMPHFLNIVERVARA